MPTLIIPTVGSRGYFQLKTPLDTLMVPNAQYTCKAIRNLSDYIANNEDPKTSIYTANSLPDAEYEADLKSDMLIVSLQSDNGHWLYIPASYILDHPVVNGIPYRSVMIGVSLPSIEVAKDLSFLLTDMGNLVTNYLGVTPTIATVETSRVVLVSREQHDITKAARALVANGRTTDKALYDELLVSHQAALNKITALEAYIQAHPPA